MDSSDLLKKEQRDSNLTPVYATLGNEEEKQQLSPLKLLWITINCLCYLGGGVTFFIGSYCYYDNVAEFNLGGWMFFIGCLLFLVATSQDFIEVLLSASAKSKAHRASNFIDGRNSATVGTSLMPHHGDAAGVNIEDLVAIFISSAYVIGSFIFCVGGFFFLEQYYAVDGTMGLTMFEIGCTVFIAGAYLDILRQTTINSDPNDRTVRMKNVMCMGSGISFCTIIGSFLFIVGSYLFMPRFIALSTNLPTHFFVIGSVFFTMSGVLCTISAIRPFLKL